MDARVLKYRFDKSDKLTPVENPGQTVEASTSLKGSLIGSIAANDVLTLKFLSPSYSAQDGTLEYIATHCDYATATVTVNAVDANDNVTIKESSASFENQQAVVKFTLQNSDGTASVSAKPLTVKVDGTEITVTPASAVGQALRASGPVAPAISTSTAEQCMPPLRQLLTSPIPARLSALPVRIADR